MRTSRVRDAFKAATGSLGLVDNAYFGLARRCNGAEEFLDMGTALASIALPRGAMPELALRVEYYIDNLDLIRDPAARHLYFLQVAYDMRFNAPAIANSEAILLAKWHMQAVFGDYSELACPAGYFAPSDFLPEAVCADYPKLEVLTGKLIDNHRAALGHTQLAAEDEYLSIAQVCCAEIVNAG